MKYPTLAEMTPRAMLRLTSAYTPTPGGCWEWHRPRTSVGYGHFHFAGEYYQAHRFLYTLLVGPVPDDLTLDHLCRNRACVNPAHLEPVTLAVNTQRGATARHTPEKVAAIRAARAAGKGVREIAREYGIDHGSVSRIVRGLRWKVA